MRVSDICRTSEKLNVMMKRLSVTVSGNLFLEKAAQFIEKNLFDEFSIDKFAREMYVSKSKLYRIIMKMTGEPPLAFIKNVKMNKALELLSNSDLTVKEIAYSSGFNNPKYFTRCFRKEFGITPKQYRNCVTRSFGYMWNGFNLN